MLNIPSLFRRVQNFLKWPTRLLFQFVNKTRFCLMCLYFCTYRLFPVFLSHIVLLWRFFFGELWFFFGDIFLWGFVFKSRITRPEGMEGVTVFFFFFCIFFRTLLYWAKSMLVLLQPHYHWILCFSFTNFPSGEKHPFLSCGLLCVCL